MRKPGKKSRNPRGAQINKFIAAARAAGCDESEEAFDAKLKALVTVKPMTNEQLKKKAKEKKD